MRNRRCVFLAVDSQKNLRGALALIAGIMKGPMAQFILGIKLNDALHAKWGGHRLVDRILERWPNLAVFLDLKISDVSSTVINTIRHYYRPGRKLYLTVMIHVGPKGFLALREEFPDLEVLVMGIPTDISEADCIETYGGPPSEVMSGWLTARDMQFQRLAESSETHLAVGAIGSFDMIQMYTSEFPWAKPVIPGIRDAWMTKGIQERTTGTVDALELGAADVVLGNQLFNGNPAANISAKESQRRTAKALDEYFDRLDQALYEETALAIFNDGGIKFGQFKLKLHTQYPEAPLSPYFISLRKRGASTEHEGSLTDETVDKIGQLIADRYGEMIAGTIQYVAGIPAAGDPIADAVMMHMPGHSKAVRLYLEKVGTGDSRTIAPKEGEVYPEGTTVMTIDDLITWAGTKIEAMKALQKAGMRNEICIVLVDRAQGGMEEAEVAGLKVIAIFKLDDLLRIYLKHGLITEDQVEEIKTYQARSDEFIRTHEPVA